METSEVLYRAADLIEERGWTTGDGWIFGDTPEGSPLCLEGGIQAALGLDLDHGPMSLLWDCPAYTAVSDYLTDEWSGHLYKWNDVSEGSRVLEVLRSCAVIEASRETARVSA